MVVLLMVDVRTIAKAIRATSHWCLRSGGGWSSLNGPLEVVEQAREHTSLAEVWSNGADIIVFHNS